MESQRLEAYQNLIDQLLTCPSGEEAQILDANADLVDAELVETMAQVAEAIAQRGEQNNADRLINLAHHLAKIIQLDFLLQVLQVTKESNSNPQIVYPLLQENLNLLDDNFAGQLRDWAAQTLPNLEVGQAQTNSLIIGAFSNLIYQFPLGSRASNLEIAIAGNEVILTVFTRKAFPEKWAATQNNLGNAYSDRIRGERSDNLENAIACYTEALLVRTRSAFPVDWAATQNNLGTAYSYRIRGERSDNLENAITCYTEALLVYTRSAFPANWAMTQNNLGTAYDDRIRGERSDNLENAIACYTEALLVRTRSAFPVDWAATQNNLGIAYSYRIRGERSDNLENAIACYTEALLVRTRSAFPEKWAATQNNLGNAYWNRIRGERSDNLENAIACYTEALLVRTRSAFPEKWAATQNNLGNAYKDRIRGDSSDNLERAIACYIEPLLVYTREAFPVDWAATQNNLGAAYKNRIRGDSSDNLESAIACCNAALLVRTRSAFPVDWAATQNNLGNAYRGRIREARSDNLERAIACYNAALLVCTRSAFPQNHAETLFNLGLVYKDVPQLPLAYDTFNTAIETVELLRSEIVKGGEQDKQKLAEEWNKLYQGIVEVCLEMGNYTAAIEYVERSKTRNLVELLATRDLYPKGEIPEAVREELQRLRQEIDVENRRLAADYTPDYTLVNQLRQRYNELYPFEPIKFDQIQNLIGAQTAIIQWYIFGDYFSAFIITPQNAQPIVWKSSAEDLANLQNWGDEYLKAYYTPREAETTAEQQELQKQWEDSIASRLQDLAEILHINEILSHIPETFNQLLLVPHLYLHLFPLHALPVNQETWLRFNQQTASLQPPTNPYLLDCFKKGVRYTPSCQLLHQKQHQQRPEFQRLFGIQTPTPDLYEQYEADLGIFKVIKELFTAYILKQAQATKSAILRLDENTSTVSQHEELLLTNCAFFFCHGNFNPNSPLDSGLQFADGWLTLADIIAHFNLKNCRLVTLAACETGLTKLDSSSDEYIGLPSGFLLAGSTNVVCSLWAVSAISTALLMIKFYEQLNQQPASIVVALNTSQCWLRDTTVQGFQDWLKNSQLSLERQIRLKQYFNQLEAQQGATAKPFESPYHWAAFCAIGQGK